MGKSALDILNIIIRIQPKGDEVEVELSPYSTGREIIREMMDAGVAPRIDPEGNQFVYEIFYKKNNLRIGEDKTLHDAGVKEGDIIYLAPKIHAGARS